MTEVFEIHITGSENILEEARPIKTISVHLLRPDGHLLRTEYMTSHVCRMANYENCRRYVEDIEYALKIKGVDIYRVKIECPYYDHYADQALYIESHFPAKNFQYPVSRNARKQTLLATDREYDRAKFEEFKERYKDAEVELCLYDTFVTEDFDWMNEYKGEHAGSTV